MKYTKKDIVPGFRFKIVTVWEVIRVYEDQVMINTPDNPCPEDCSESIEQLLDRINTGRWDAVSILVPEIQNNYEIY
jgi:hypothetical protein